MTALHILTACLAVLTYALGAALCYVTLWAWTKEDLAPFNPKRAIQWSMGWPLLLALVVYWGVRDATAGAWCALTGWARANPRPARAMATVGVLVIVLTAVGIAKSWRYL